MIEKQNKDNSYGGYRERDGAEMWRAGSYAGPAGSNTPAYSGGFTLVFNVAGGTDTGGGILSWQNLLGYDILVYGHALDVTTGATSGTCTVEAGETTTATGTATNMMSAQNVHTAGIFNGGALSVAVPQNDYITISTAASASAGMVAKAYFFCVPRPAAGVA